MKEPGKYFPTTEDIEKLKEGDMAFVKNLANIQYGLLESPKNIVRAIIQHGGDKSFFILLEGMCVKMIHISFYLIYEKDENFLSSDLFFTKIGKLPKNIVTKILSFDSYREKIAIVLCKLFVSNAPIPLQREIDYLCYCRTLRNIRYYIYRLCASWKKTRILKMLLKEEIEKEEKILFLYSMESKNFYSLFIVKNIISKKQEKY